MRKKDNDFKREVETSEEEVTRLKVKEKELSNWNDILLRDLDFLENLVRRIDGKVNEGYGKQFPIREDLEMFCRFIKEELIKYFPEKM